ncbi:MULTISPECIES: hypothetical protein [Thermus]|uniref:hypothetical protein n=1 Tax=Thermus TaxID=270 RepID=UPI001F1F6476|nr:MULTISPECIES: hypothetical protein [Thermus]
MEPKREGNPRRFFLGLLALALLLHALALFLMAQEDPEGLPLLAALLLLEFSLTAALLYAVSRLPERLYYELDGNTLTVHLPFGRRVVHRAQVEAVRPLAYALPWWAWKGEAAMPGYHRRRLRLEGRPVEALVGARRGEGVLLLLKDGKGLLLNPLDPTPLLSWKAP